MIIWSGSIARRIVKQLLYAVKHSGRTVLETVDWNAVRTQGQLHIPFP